MRTAWILVVGLASATLALPAAAQLAQPHETLRPNADDAAEAKTGFFFSPAARLGFNAARPSGFTPGLRADSERNLLVGYRFGNWMFGSSLTHVYGLNESAANQVDVRASYGLNLTPRQRLSIDGGLSMSEADAAAFRPTDPFGLQALTDTGSAAGLRLSWRYSFDANRYISTMLGYEHRFGMDGQTPGSERDSASIGTFFGYRFH